MTSFLRGRLLASSLLSAAILVSPALAQTTESGPATADAASAPADDIIVVTGSRIPRAAYDNNQPTITTTGAVIDDRAITSVGAALNQTPGFGVADSSL